jgi:hypothetical protein
MPKAIPTSPASRTTSQWHGHYAQKYASKNGSSWTLETADENGDVGTPRWRSMPRAIPTSLTKATHYELRYAVKRGVTWVIEPTLDGMSPWHWMLCGNAPIVYRHGVHSAPQRNKYDLKYASDVGGMWKVQKVDRMGSVGWGASIGEYLKNRACLAPLLAAPGHKGL